MNLKKLVRRASHIRIKKRTWIALWIIALVLPISIKLFLKPQETEASWWNYSWQYRQAISLSNSSNYDATDIPYRVMIDTASLISAGKMQSDGDDIRIVDHNGQIPRFQIEQSTLNSSTTGIWIEADVPSLESVQYYIYYGNSEATALSFDSDFSSITGDGTNVETKDNFQYETTTSYGKLADIQKNNVNLGVNGAYRNTDSYLPSAWWNDHSFTRTLLSSGPLFVEVEFSDSNYASYSSYGTVVQMFDNGFVHNRVFINYNATETEDLYYYLNFDSGTRNVVWVNGSGTLVDQSANSGNLYLADLGENWFGQRWLDTSLADSYGGTIINPNGTDWTHGSTSAIDSYFQTNYSDTATYNSGDLREIRWGTFAGNGGLSEMQEKGGLYGAQTTTLGNEEVSSKPIAEWKFDEGYGTTANDSAGNNDGTITGATWTSEDQCISGKCLYFDGNDDQVVSSTANYDAAGKDKYSFSLWIKPQGYTNDFGVILGSSYGNNIRNGITLQNTNKLYFRDFGTVSTAVYLADLDLNSWAHITITYDNGQAYAYVNGNLVKSFSYTKTDTDTAVNIARATNMYGETYRAFKGYIDEIKIYPYVLSLDQIKQDLNKGQAVILGAKDTGPLSEGLVGYWKMDETSSPSLDFSGRGYDATWSGDASSTTGKFGGGINQTDGGGGYLAVADTGDPFDMGTSNFSVAMWFQVDSLTAPNAPELFSKRDGGGFCGGSKGYHLRVAYNDEIEFYVEGADDCLEINSANGAITTGTWYHVVAVYDQDSGSKIYINGQQSGSTVPGNVGSTDNAGNLRIGHGVNGWEMDGKYDEVRVYDRALSANEVTDLYHYAPGPLGYWKMDEGSGTTLYDSSGNNLNLAISGGPSFEPGKFGNALTFTDGSDAQAILASDAFSINDFTYGFWFKLNNSNPITYRQVFSITSDTSNRQPAVWHASSKDCFHPQEDPGNQGFGCAGPSGTNTYWNLGQWYYYSQTKQGTNLKYYVNGKLMGEMTVTDPMTNGTNPYFVIGKNNSYKSTGITIDEFKLYNYSRTPQQIVEDMNAGHPAGGSPIGSQVAYWKFDEGYGTTANDTVENYTGTLTNGPTWENAKVNKGISFDGDNDYISVPFTTSIPTFTATMWVKPEQIDARINGILSHINPSDFNNQDWRINIDSSSKAYFGAYDGEWNFVQGTTTLQTGQWYHIAAVADQSSDLKLYVNGSLEGSDTSFGTLSNTGTHLAIGSGRVTDEAGNENGKNIIDEVKIYSSALTEEQIKIDYNAGLSTGYGVMGPTEASILNDGQGNDPIAEWNFDENTGSTANDTSGNGNTGTITGASWKGGCKVGNCLSFDTNSFVNLYSSNFTSNFDPDEGTIVAWAKVTDSSIWTDGDWHMIMRIRADAANDFTIDKSNTDNNLRVFREANDIRQTISTTDYASNDWFMISSTWSVTDNEFKMYVNGNLIDTQTGLQNFVGSIDSSYAVIGGMNTTPSYPWEGLVDQVKIYDYARTPAQIAYDYNRGKPITYYKLDECQGTTIYEQSGSGLNGTLTIGGSGSQTSAGTCSTSGAWYNGATGKYNASMSFDGTDDFVSINSFSGLPTGANPFTLSAWIKPVGYGTYGIIGYGNYGTAGQVNALRMSPTGFKHYFWSNDLDCTVTGLTDGSWHHVVVTYSGSGGTRSMYVDGSLKCSNNPSDPSVQSSAVTIGKTNIAEYFPGQIDDVRIFNYALSADQVKQMMNEGVATRFGE